MKEFALERREALKKIALLSGSLAVPGTSLLSADFKEVRKTRLPQKPVTAITLGAGNRGNVYGNYAVAYPDELDIIGVAEPIPIRNDRYALKHEIPANRRFITWEHVFDLPKFADAVLITTPDHLHYGPCMKALEMGYHVLLEKPISPSEKECRDILQLAKKTGQIVAVCHVLRYAPYFIELRNLVQSGSLGELVSIQHLEPIQHIHMAHSYVRGNWHNSKKSTPIILGKSCHDLDVLRWIVDKPCRKITAFGDLKWFRSKNAPPGSTARCTDRCAVENTCPYSALKIYFRDRTYTYVFDFPDDESLHEDFILDQLKTTDYGRCVYRMDNDQPDHYVTSILFEDDITASFSMEAFTSYHGRRTRIMGAMGDVVGDMSTFTYTSFRTGEKVAWNIAEYEAQYKDSGHGGGDWRLVADWINAISNGDASLLTSSIDVSIESHMMGFMAEKSRKEGMVMEVKL